MLLIELIKLFTSFFFLISVPNQYFLVVQMGEFCLFFVPFRWYKIKQIFRDKFLPVLSKIINSGNVDKAALGYLEAAAAAMFAVISKALPGFFKTFLPSFLIH